MSNLQTLHKVVDLATRRRDDALTALGQAQRELQAAQAQMNQLRNYADGTDEIVVKGDSARTVDEIQREALEAIADEINRMLDEGVVAEVEDVDTALILGAGWPFWLGGISRHLDQTGISERVTGGPLWRAGARPVTHS